MGLFFETLYNWLAGAVLDKVPAWLFWLLFVLVVAGIAALLFL